MGPSWTEVGAAPVEICCVSWGPLALEGSDLPCSLHLSFRNKGYQTHFMSGEESSVGRQGDTGTLKPHDLLGSEILAEVCSPKALRGSIPEVSGP